MARLERELAALRDADKAEPKDDVLALLDTEGAVMHAISASRSAACARAADVAAVAAAGAAYAGFVFFPKSPRNLTLAEARARWHWPRRTGCAKVALVVDADDATLDAIVEAVPLDMLQLHGHETPDRVAEVRARYGLPVMKAIGVADEATWRRCSIIRWWPTRC